MKRFWKRNWAIIVAIPCFVVALVLAAIQSGIIGLQLSGIEEMEHKHREVPTEWSLTQTHNQRLAALVFYNENKDDASFSVYTKRDGLYFGYYLRYYGDMEEIGDQVLGLRVLDRKSPPAVALLSMNSQRVAEVEVTDAQGTTRIEVDPENPFALVFMDPQEITLFDDEGNPVEIETMLERSNEVVGNQAPAPEGEENSAG